MAPRAVVVALVLIVAVVATMYMYVGPPRLRSSPGHARLEDEAIARADSVDLDGTVSPSGLARDRAPSEALRQMSPSFRNSTLLIAIRDAGFYCDEVVTAQEIGDGLWVATCPGMLGYRLSAHERTRFDVAPIARYFDSPGPPVPTPDRRAPAPLDPQRFR